MIWNRTIGWIISYLILHFCAYAFVLRRRQIFLREDVIFLYHVGSLFLALTAVFFIPLPVSAPVAAGVVLGVHGIYSLTFLSFWSSSDGGYSLRIVNYLDLLESQGRQADLKDLEALGESKKKDRIESVLHLKLVEKANQYFSLTWKGRLIAGAIRGLDWICNIRRSI